MEESMLEHLDIKETWSKTMNLRFIYGELECMMWDETLKDFKQVKVKHSENKILQQQYKSNLGNTKWENIEFESE
jgi:hypothetical protein